MALAHTSYGHRRQARSTRWSAHARRHVRLLHGSGARSCELSQNLGHICCCLAARCFHGEHGPSSTCEAPANGVFAEGSSHRRHQWHRHNNRFISSILSARLCPHTPSRAGDVVDRQVAHVPSWDVSPTLACFNSYLVQLHTRIVLLGLVVLLLEAARHAAPRLCSAW